MQYYEEQQYKVIVRILTYAIFLFGIAEISLYVYRQIENNEKKQPYVLHACYINDNCRMLKKL